MKIRSVQAIPLSIPFEVRSRLPAWRGKDFGALEILLVRIETEDGCVGWGEAFSYACQVPVKAAIEQMIAPLLIGQDARRITGLMHDVQKVLHIYGRYGVVNFALSGVDIALWDMAGRRAGLSLVELLGGANASTIDAYASLFRFDDPDRVAEAARAAVSAGYKSMKVHTRGSVDVGAVRGVVGSEIPLMVDTNCHWTPAEASRLAHALKAYDIRWLEEPIYPPESFDALRDLRQESGIPIAIGENACTVHEFQKILAAGAATYVQPSVAKVGGITEFRKVAALTEAYGASLAPHSTYFGPGFLATLHLIAAQPAAPRMSIEHFVVGPEASLYGGALDVQDGAFALPPGPGLGLQPDGDVLRDYRVKPA
ncbi:mandelate racemase/muconate lactonizing enzyme family protein [Verticiella sediminum]|uniref:Mandelate racemase/muconate lactonizing enzyme family protein n=1 Tax=Verticiella sediminum TaxID=1247510 RepID=A0A556AIZ4_9BURK|nr:mandelate racemase/muconate lactonizing enzyme family protein [Verticiella sediminum]TSH92835.1 mandelate racemase/muconate lactonizing enzyme family protein [Verticiella sediminum]